MNILILKKVLAWTIVMIVVGGIIGSLIYLSSPYWKFILIDLILGFVLFTIICLIMWAFQFLYDNYFKSNGD